MGGALQQSMRRRSIQQNQNGRRYFWLVVGYYLCTVYIKSSTGKTDNEAFTAGPFSKVLPIQDIPGSGNRESHNMEHSDEDHAGIHVAKVDFAEVETPFIIALWIFCASLAKIGFHMAPRLSRIFPESCLLIVVGVVIGLLLFHTNSVHVSPLTPKTFFHYMLPPIILDAGYFMPNRMFFNNLGTILLMAVVGTLWNTFTIGFSLWGLGALFDLYGIQLPLLQCLLFGSLISAVDPVAVLAVFEEIHVNEILYIVVFGESLLNDAVTVVLYRMFEEYAKMDTDQIPSIEIIKGCASFPVVALGGTAIGIIWGFLTGFVTRFTNQVRVIEPIFIFVMAYLAYLCAETFHMSGILAVTFCGITMKNYVEANISQKSHTTAKYAMKMLSSSSETIIFMFLGVSTIHDDHEWNWTFIAATILFCTIYRIIGTLFLSWLANRTRLHKLNRVDQFVMAYGGLRGAVAFALVLLVTEDIVGGSHVKHMFTTTTITVIYFTVFLQGITIKPLVQWLKVKKAFKRRLTMNERIHERLFDHTMAGLETIVGQFGHYNIREKFKKFDNRYIRPCLLRDSKGAEPKILETYSKLALRDAMEVMHKNPTACSNINLNKLTSESMAQLIRNYTMNGNISGIDSSQDFTSFPPLDMHDLEYNLSRRNMSDAKIHHLLAEELYKPQRRHRRLSYSRHTVDEKDLGTEAQVKYKMPMNFKKMVSEKALKTGKSRKDKILAAGQASNHRVTFGEEYDNPAFSMSDEKFSNGASEDVGIYFIAGGGTKVSPVRRLTRDEDAHSPTAMEVILPWKRGEEDAEGNIFPIRQNEFPAWATNKEYMAYHSPTTTFLGGIGGQAKPPSVIGLFKRDSVSSVASGSRRDSLQSRFDSPRHSIGSENLGGSSSMSITSQNELNDSPNPNVPVGRRGSTFINVTIPEDPEDEKEPEDDISARDKKSEEQNKQSPNEINHASSYTQKGSNNRNSSKIPEEQDVGAELQETNASLSTPKNDDDEADSQTKL